LLFHYPKRLRSRSIYTSWGNRPAGIGTSKLGLGHPSGRFRRGRRTTLPSKGAQDMLDEMSGGGGAPARAYDTPRGGVHAVQSAVLRASCRTRGSSASAAAVRWGRKSMLRVAMVV
jgi:hypothetical protein